MPGIQMHLLGGYRRVAPYSIESFSILRVHRRLAEEFAGDANLWETQKRVSTDIVALLRI